MEYCRLGDSGLKISKVILGCQSYGSPEWQSWILNEESSLPLLKHAFDVGITTWDTANIYSHGESERLIAKAIKKYDMPRKRLVIMTKCYFPVAEDGTQPAFSMHVANDSNIVNQMGLSRKHIFDAVNDSVDRLGTYIDVLQIHRLDRETPKEEIMKALNDVIESGKVRYIGASSMAAWEFQTLQNIASTHGWHRFISMQNYHNLIYREEEREMIPYCKATGVGLIPWSPIARGALARPFDDRGSLREQTDKLVNARARESQADRSIIERVEEVAKRCGVSMAAVATAWSIRAGDCPVIGLSSIERIDQTVQNLKFKLSDEDAKYLEEPYLPKNVQGY